MIFKLYKWLLLSHQPCKDNKALADIGYKYTFN